MSSAPAATYRLQLGPAFTLDDATALVPYLADLGVSHLYTSPLSEAEAGSTHGYDVVDHHMVREELGGEPALRRLWEVLLAHGMRQVLDLVPNHMSIATPRNRWWWNLLEEGAASRYAAYFDVEWDAPRAFGRVVLPFLDRPLTDAIDRGALVAWHRPETGEIVLRHGERSWPISSSSLTLLGLSPTDDPERIAEAVDAANRDRARLRELAASQHYELVHWRDREHRLNYRRFFDIDTLAAVRVDDPEVFDDVHRLLARWLHDDLASQVIQGIRVDHVDGIADPAAYLTRLRELVGDRWIVVEKVLAPGEALPPSWPVAGTTGYDVTARLIRPLVAPEAEASLVELARTVDPQERSWDECVVTAKRELARGMLLPEALRAARALMATDPAIDEDDALERVIEEAVALPVYRRYDPEPDRQANGYPSRLAQLTAPLAAKAVEDTAFYRWLTLLALNEVGNDPSLFGVRAATVHASTARAASAHPAGMSAVSTHDTKWSADARIRLALISHDVPAWRDTVAGWSERNRRHRIGGAPDQAIEYLYYQALVAAWPIDRARASAYLLKAARERKRQTSWTDPDDAYERAVDEFVATTLADAEFTSSVAGYVARLTPPARILSLAQVTLLLTMPGVPDLYQGDELWNHALVDPDNRRPVDFVLRRQALCDAASVDPAELWGEGEPWGGDELGITKLGVIHRLLRLRRARPDLFDERSGYAPIPMAGAGAGDLLGFERGGELAVVVPLRVDLTTGRTRHATVELAPGEWVDVLSGWQGQGGPTTAAELHEALPVAVLVRGPAPDVG